MKTQIITALCSVLFSATIAVQNAGACARRIDPMPRPVPEFSGESPYAAILTPIRITALDRGGVRYWRAVYELVRHRNAPPPYALGANRIVVEWSCDPVYGEGDVCGSLTSRVLPGFGAEGRPNETFVQLDLKYAHNSSLDGVPLFYASRDGALALEAPVVVYPFDRIKLLQAV